jgi:membrane protein
MALIKGKDVWPLLKQTGSDWSEDKAPKLAAALATYTMLSIAPLLVIVTKIVGIVYRNGAGKKISDTLQNVMPGVGGEAIEKMIEQASKPGQGTVATVVSILVAAYGATGVFAELQDSMNTIWEVKPKPLGIMGWLRARFFSFATVLGLAFLFMVSTVGSAVVIGLGNRMSAGNAVVAWVLTHLVSLVVMTVLFGLIFKLLPDAKMEWRDVILGAVVTAVLFEIGKVLLAIYIDKSAKQTFGAAGSLAALLLWVYYSAQILFFGAEFTQAYTKKYGSGIQPSNYAVKVTSDERAQQGMVTDQRLAAKTAQAEGRKPAGAGRRPAAAQSWAGRQGVPSPAIPRYGMTPVGAGEPDGHGTLRRVAIAGVGAAVGALAGALGATAMAKETKRPARKHLAAVQLDQRLKNVEQRVGKISRIHQYLEDEAVYNRIKQVEQRIRHARGLLRAQENRRPNWLVRLGDAIAGNKN